MKPPSPRVYLIILRTKNLSIRRRCGGTGRHVRLRGVWSDPWEFDSPHRHHLTPFFVKVYTIPKNLRVFGAKSL